MERVRAVLPPSMQDQIFFLDNELLIDNEDTWGAPLQTLLSRVCGATGKGKVVLIASRGMYMFNFMQLSSYC